MRSIDNNDGPIMRTAKYSLLETAATSALNAEPTADFAALISTLLDAGALIPTDSRTG